MKILPLDPPDKNPPAKAHGRKIWLNYVKQFGFGHRTVVSITVRPSLFARIFLWKKPVTIIFHGWGKDFVVHEIDSVKQ